MTDDFVGHRPLYFLSFSFNVFGFLASAGNISLYDGHCALSFHFPVRLVIIILAEHHRGDGLVAFGQRRFLSINVSVGFCGRFIHLRWRRCRLEGCVFTGNLLFSDLTMHFLEIIILRSPVLCSFISIGLLFGGPH